ncbi:interferon-inducible double-stranded RNA-dependent protein kinase activator a homolog a [Plakobranchus ocellatus]|uniref:Interferon-inducible double-stranded RNA-dependent protein kinase activator a homolog a n=1 Tax=Plakobranchus ocellatus TaxID=259542 RepID=A0AAV4CKX0_9GAST|nr:interferon-inducible double-stranded RNA-dependent protein kinase activator a homolog a [Plakobranchus ocellatus]
MTVPPGKTPISYLQEYATRHAVTPQYDLLANEGAVHEPTFIMRVTVGENATATGRGSSKKKAKHAAAQNALKILEGETPNGPEETAVKEVVSSTSPSDCKDDNAGNPIGELQEFTQKKLLKPPIYEFVTEQGPPHAREFICNIKLGKFVDKGTGRSKKTAKRTAAANMLAQLKSLSHDKESSKQLEDSDEDEEIVLGFEPSSSYSGLKKPKKSQSNSVSPQSALEIQRFYEKVMTAGGKQVRGQGQTLTPPTNYCQMLQEIAEVQRFEVQYFDIKDDSAIGMNQCLVQLSTVPVAVCQGTGPIMDEAHANAAHNALQYLRIMIK